MAASRYLTTVRGFRPHGVPSRSIRCRGALIVWVLPALAVLAGASYWFLTAPLVRSNKPAPPGDKAFASIPSPTPSQATPRPGVSRKIDSDVVQTVAQGFKTTSRNVPAKLHSDVKAKLPETKSDAEIEAALVGEWSGYYQGQRKLKVGADGLGTMVARPAGLAATLLAAELTFEIRWKLNGDRLEFETVGGEPLDKVNVVVKMYGRNRSHKILELQSDKMVLLDEDGVTKYVWNRVTSEPQATSAPAK